MYIRTDEGHIYERIEQRILKCVYCGGEQYRHNLNSEWENIIDQADTIEELCDYFVTESPSVELKYRFNVYKTLNGAKKCAYANGNEINIYGHIWNGITLTPVAKLNREGELELL